MSEKSAVELTCAIKTYLREECDRGFFGAVLVSYEGQRIIDGVYGSIRGQEITNAHRFCLASLGKQFTSAAVLKCVERELLALDSSIADFLPKVSVEKQAITILHLLSHTSGWLQSYAGENHSNRESAVAAILAQPLASKPGSEFDYSNNNYQLVAAIIETVTNSTIRDFLRLALFLPAGLEDTGLLDMNSVLRLAPAQESFPPRFSQPYWGQQGYYSTARDLFRWYTTLRVGQVLKGELAGKLFEPVVPIREGDSALGWFTGETENGVKYIFSRGNEDFGANSLFYAYPKWDSVIIVLTHAGDKNGGTSYSRAIHHWIEKQIF